ncbi:hypothetical protein [Gordonia amicalis]|uniref:hypothetical protein n=1 Tax=Gordonia amicalis TaxID=89053 RepID=UPI0024BBCBF0|nr:hypothetical protein [Gordonia amicalis]MDJ0454085.1 hypothetical protein [Gordonia amicalis]MDV7077229.1 hypothetical protein [Gordonia amicalis]
MSHNIIRTAFIAPLAGSVLLLGAGAASADTAPVLADGPYTLDVATPISIGLPATIGSVPATVDGGQLTVGGVTIPATLDAFDEDGDGATDGAVVLVGGSTWGVLR